MGAACEICAGERTSPRLREENRAQATKITKLEGIVQNLTAEVSDLKKQLDDREIVALKHARKSALDKAQAIAQEKRLKRRASLVSDTYAKVAGTASAKIVVRRSEPRSGMMDRSEARDPPLTLSSEEMPRPTPTEVTQPLDDSVLDDLETLIQDVQYEPLWSAAGPMRDCEKTVLVTTT